MSAAQPTPDRRLLVVLSPYAVAPPRHGPQIRVAGVLSNLGEHWRVEHFAQSIQRTDLPLPPRSVVGGPRWTEHRLLDPLSWAWLVGLARIGDYPAAYADRLLGWLPRRRVVAALRAADAVMVTPHYQYAWVRPHTPATTGVVVDVHSVEADHWEPRRAAWTRRVVAEIRRGERAAYASADVCFATSEDDAVRVRELGGRDVVIVRNGVDVGRFVPVSSATERAASRRAVREPVDGVMAVFVGGAGFANRNAVEWLVRQAPDYASQGIRVVVVGRVGLGRAAVPGVRWVGEVDDVLPWLRAADVAICPLLEGSGTSLKTVEYMAAGLPIVSTPVGVRGLGVVDGVHAVVCDVEAMPAAAGALVRDAGRMQRLGAAARELCVSTLSWESAGRAATEVFDRLALRRDAALRGAAGADESQAARRAAASSS
jgi:glycosyltransferase involved in cell wall biosynthesis